MYLPSFPHGLKRDADRPRYPSVCKNPICKYKAFVNARLLLYVLHCLSQYSLDSKNNKNKTHASFNFNCNGAHSELCMYFIYLNSGFNFANGVKSAFCTFLFL